MFSWLQPPTLGSNSDADLQAWFVRMADHLLRRTRLIVDRQPHRLVEIEFYYFGESHLDPFTHRDPIQLECGRWYFHRTGGVYRSGSFKGLDLSFGDGKAHGGVLIRSLEAPDGSLIDGPSLCVDHLLKRTDTATINELDKAIAGRPAWERGNRLLLEETSEVLAPEPLRTARVGLTLKKVKPPAPERTRFILRRYRFLTDPRGISKGKPHMVLALHAQGHDATAIQQLTGCGKTHIKRYAEDFAAGQQQADFTPFFGIELGTRELCQLHGVWHKVHALQKSD